MLDYIIAASFLDRAAIQIVRLDSYVRFFLPRETNSALEKIVSLNLLGLSHLFYFR